MHFQVNKQNYFLDFIDEEGRWILFKPTRSGIEALPVVDDDATPDDVTVVTTDHETIN